MNFLLISVQPQTVCIFFYYVTFFHGEERVFDDLNEVTLEALNIGTTNLDQRETGVVER